MGLTPGGSDAYISFRASAARDLFARGFSTWSISRFDTPKVADRTAIPFSQRPSVVKFLNTTVPPGRQLPQRPVVVGDLAASSAFPHPGHTLL